MSALWVLIDRVLGIHGRGSHLSVRALVEVRADGHREIAGSALSSLAGC